MSLDPRAASTWVLILSLALNLFFVGAITARMLNRPDFRPLPPNVGWILRDLDQQTRDGLRPQLMQYGEEIRPLRGRMFRAQRQINNLMASEPLDQEAIAAAFGELRAANLAYQEAGHEQTLRVFAALSPEQRQRALSFMRDRRNPLDGDRDDRDRSRESRSDDGRRPPPPPL